MLWIKAFHVIFVVTWFAGLFYLPRLFVYHVDCEEEAGQARFKTMERKLLAITTIGGIGALAFGLMLLPYWQHAFTFDTLWLPIKLVLVAALIAYHGYLWLLTRRFADDRNRHGQRQHSEPVAASFDQCVPAGVQHGRQQHQRDHPDVEGHRLSLRRLARPSYRTLRWRSLPWNFHGRELHCDRLGGSGIALLLC